MKKILIILGSFLLSSGFLGTIRAEEVASEATT